MNAPFVKPGPVAVSRRPRLAAVAWMTLLSSAALAMSPASSIASTPAASCSDVHAANPTAPDGTYTVTVGADSFSVYCLNMSTTPQEYISLVNTGAGANFSQYTAGDGSPGTNVVTHYTKLRIDPTPVSSSPLTFRVNIADQTFSSSSGQLNDGGSTGNLVTSMPYAVAFDCMRSGSASGLANLDFTGTPFGVVNTFSLQGSAPVGSTSYTPQVVNLTAGGFCGWNAPATTFNPFNTRPLSDANGGYDLEIAIVGNPPTCKVTGLTAGPPAQQQVTVTASGGLAEIFGVSQSNGINSVAPFSNGTTGPVLVTETKIDQTKPTVWSFYAEDESGHITYCH